MRMLNQAIPIPTLIPVYMFQGSKKAPILLIRRMIDRVRRLRVEGCGIFLNGSE